MQGLVPAAWRASTDRVALIVLGMLSIARGMCYLPEVIPPGHRIPALEDVAPLPWWTSVWFVVGVVAIVAGLTMRVQAVAVGVFVAANTLWGMLYCTAWAAGHSDRGYVTALSYFTIALLATWAFGRGRAGQ